LVLKLVNVLYILDELALVCTSAITIVLSNHWKKLRDAGNSVIVVEHDKDMIVSADYIVDIGPFAGRMGGNIVAQGKSEEIINSGSLTAEYLNHHKNISIPEKRRKGLGKFLVLKDACGNNLKSVTVRVSLRDVYLRNRRFR